jgi:AcrR family transcriptional regulator
MIRAAHARPDTKGKRPPALEGTVTRNPQRTQRAILKAATVEFAHFGLGGARIDRIAEKSGSNKRLIYYYFGSKDALFRVVLENAYADIRSAEQALHLDALDPAEAVRQLIAFTWNYYLSHPEFLTLLNSENLHRAAHLKSLPHIRKMNSPLIAMLDVILERGRTERLFRRGVDAVQLYISIAALAYFYLSNNATLSTIFGRDLLAPKAKAERLSHMTELVLGYLLL